MVNRSTSLVEDPTCGFLAREEGLACGADNPKPVGGEVHFHACGLCPEQEMIFATSHPEWGGRTSGVRRDECKHEHAEGEEAKLERTLPSRIRNQGLP